MAITSTLKAAPLDYAGNLISNPSLAYVDELIVQGDYFFVDELNTKTKEILSNAVKQHLKEAKSHPLTRLVIGVSSTYSLTLIPSALMHLAQKDEAIESKLLSLGVIILWHASICAAGLLNAIADPATIKPNDPNIYQALLVTQSKRIEEILDAIRLQKHNPISDPLSTEVTRLENLQKRIQLALTRIRKFPIKT